MSRKYMKYLNPIIQPVDKDNPLNLHG